MIGIRDGTKNVVNNYRNHILKFTVKTRPFSGYALNDNESMIHYRSGPDICKAKVFEVRCSSLNYLWQYIAIVIKIGKSFIIFEFSQKLNINAIAEEIVGKEQLECEAWGCLSGNLKYVKKIDSS